MGFDPKTFLLNAAQRATPPVVGFGLWGTMAVFVLASDGVTVKFLELGAQERSLPLGEFMARGWRSVLLERGDVASVEDFLSGVGKARTISVELRLRVLQGLLDHLTPEEQSFWRNAFREMDGPTEGPT